MVLPIKMAIYHGETNKYRDYRGYIFGQTQRRTQTLLETSAHPFKRVFQEETALPYLGESMFNLSFCKICKFVHRYSDTYLRYLHKHLRKKEMYVYKFTFVYIYNHIR